jgi:hypothetical protein
MRSIVAALALSALASCTPTTGTAFAGPPAERQPVIVELFSSEGCSSCPPADTLLASLARAQPVPGAEVIALEFHVDYWNYLGWSDPFSNAAFSGRQRAYSSAFGLRSIYTPQMVVDGRAEVLGSDRDGAKSAIADAARAPRAKLTLALAGDKIAVTVADLPDAKDPSSVWLAITEEGLRTDVPRGENAGSTLAHGPIVRSLARIAAIPAGARTFAGESTAAIDPAWKRASLRAVAFVQRDRSMAIAGAAALAIK